ncbi:hypothetical protein CHLNCDRAFT_57163 [Chlorella variabilis]|uniref:tRNA threonylcarbamoyladenosine biosynthesis protein TsaE n=1 Tax=Chlorella variabilis TaxID=554065 RepID=E1Z769_CHLVA|nr:hypothetical protein CHLNCDRAFT_57163 [Chlorella variabilis]EFN58117.1 hypothetical protein CHLNCDRAFT_57163 [Chlorella variabilis]|eukprot:XP_005850219.1 hypothetical protein CHLNCDRAFT_57163 [Chlorella variabilis]
MQLRALLLFQAPGMGRQRSLVARGLRVLAQQDQEAEAQLAAAPDRRLSVLAASPTATQLLAHFCACELRPADCYLLYGSVGAGKSYFSRAFIRAAAKDEELPVPSPTFLLQNIYTDHQGPPIHHFDLYRLTKQYEFARLDLRTSFNEAVSLVEWPERLDAHHQPAERLEVHISILEAAEQERLQRQRAPTENGWRGDEEAEQDGSTDECSGDMRWRRISLKPFGQRWLLRLQLLQRYLQAEGAQLDCHMERGLLEQES